MLAKLFRLRGELNAKLTTTIQIVGLGIILGMWSLISGFDLVPASLLPSPLEVLSSFKELHFQDALVLNVFYSIKINMMGYLQALLIAIPLGFVVGLLPICRELFRRYIDAFRYLPLTALTGLFIAWFGIEDAMKIQFLSFGIVVYLLPVVIQRISEVEKVYVDTIYTLGANKWQTIREVFMPAVLSRISDDARVLVAISWTYIIVAELINKSAGGEYFNRGFKPNAESQYRQKYGFDVEFVVMDEFVPSREAFKSGSVDLLWGTVDSFPTEVEGMHQLGAKILFQADWSRGGDAVVVRRGIGSVSDLKGKKVAVAFGTPSHTFLLWLLNAGDLTQKDVQVIEVPSAIDAAAVFKAGKVDAAVVWSPDDEDCVSKVNGAKVLKSTRDADHIIADVFYVKDSFLFTHKQVLAGLVEGWLTGAAEINSNPQALDTAAGVLAQGLNLPKDWAVRAIHNARLTTYGDNVNFFDLHGGYDGVKGEDMYSNMAKAYNAVRLAPDTVPAWRQVVDTSVLASLNLTGQLHAPEVTVAFTAPTVADTKVQAFSTKRLSITFASGSDNLDDNAQTIIDLSFADIAQSFGRARIRVEGNTDSVGSVALNKNLSLRRAKAVTEYLVREYHFDTNRFVVVGNGDGKPVADNDTPTGRAKNRRTDFELLSQE